MTDRGIIFSAPMVRGLIREIQCPGTGKTQTRRLPFDERGKPTSWHRLAEEWERGQREQRLWVREAFRLRLDQDDKPPSQDWWKAGAWYFADDPTLEPSGCGGGAGKLRPSIHMPRWASRITLTVTEVRRQRLQDISEEDAQAEGIIPHIRGGWHWHPHNPQDLDDWHQFGFVTRVFAFEDLWERIHGIDSWDANPDIVALTFSVALRNIDAKEAA